MEAGAPPSYTADGDTQQQNIAFDVGLSFAVLFLIITAMYALYFCKRSPPPPPPPASNDTDTDDENSTKLCRRLDGDNDVLVQTLPTFLFSAAVNDGGSGCSVCLVDYKTGEVLRSLPDCGHFFHAKCVDRWLKVHLTCPVCRKELNSGLP